MLIVKNHIANDPNSGLSVVAMNLKDGVYPNLKIVQKGIPPNGLRPFRDDLCNPEPHSVRGFNTIGDY